MTQCKLLISGIALAAACFAGCGVNNAGQSQDEQASDGTLSIVVSIVPQAYFVRRVAGELATVEVLAPPNHTAETHQVTPRQMDTLSHADVYFRIGMPFETPLVNRLAASYPRLKIVDTRAGVPMLGGVCAHAHEHNDHRHEGDDPHIWLDPMRVKIQARTIAAALSALAPQHSRTFSENLQSFERDLDALHRRLTKILAPVRGKIIYVYHPAFGYLADAYGFEQRAIETEGKSPGSKRLYEVIDEIKGAEIRAVFDQPQFADGSVWIIAEAAGVAVISLDALMDHYPAGMENIARAIAQAAKATS